jgi:tetratricopeptide (TPR) repeat protein
MGFIYNQKLKASTAANLLKQSLKLRIQCEGKKSLNVGKTCEQLGSCLMALGQHEDALKLYVTCLEIYKDELGTETMECARVMLDIASLYSYKQQFDLALLQLTGSLDFMEHEYGLESEQVAAVLLRIGQVHDMRVDNEEAMKCVSRALQIRIQLYTKDDIRVAETYLICGNLLEDWGDIEEVSRAERSIESYQMNHLSISLISLIYMIGHELFSKCSRDITIEKRVRRQTGSDDTRSNCWNLCRTG